MKPSTLILTSHADFVNAVETGKAVGALVKKYRMANQVIVSSFDLIKSLNAQMVRNKGRGGGYLIFQDKGLCHSNRKSTTHKSAEISQ